MKIKISELTGAALDWAVAKCKGEQLPTGGMYMQTWPMYSLDWAYAGPIIEREKIGIEQFINRLGQWRASYTTPTKKVLYQHGPTMLIAAMRCYVASKLGDEVDVPEELLWTGLSSC